MAELDLNGPAMQALVKRIAAEPAPKTDTKKAKDPKSLSPDVAMMLSSLADGATTYSFLKRGRASESNGLYGATGNDPLKTGLAVAGTGLLRTLAMKFLKDKMPSLTPVIDASTANAAASRMNAASEGITLPSRYATLSPLNDYKTRIVQEIGREHRTLAK